VVLVLGKMLANMIGRRTRSSLLGPADRLLGAGFGAVKGLLVATVCFVLFTICYDALYGVETSRPDWLRLSRAYPLLSASGSAMSEWVAENSRNGGLIGGIMMDEADNATNATQAQP